MEENLSFYKEEAAFFASPISPKFSVLRFAPSFSGERGYAYDQSGNTTQKGTQRFTYNYRNALIQHVDGDGTTTFKYDTFGRRTEKAVGSSITKYIYAGNQVIEEYNGSTLNKQYVYGSGIDEVFNVKVLTGAKAGSYYYHTDGIGSVTAITDSNGDIVERVKYGIYGVPTILDATGTEIASSSIGNEYMFQGRRYDASLNMYHYRARAYDPTTGRFLQNDPLGYIDSMNLYQGMNMNPYNYTDPLGETVREKDTKNIVKYDTGMIVGLTHFGTRRLAKMRFLFTNNNKLVIVHKILKAKPNETTNCIGHAFGDGEDWYHPNQANILTSGGEYEKIDAPEDDAIIVYRDADGNVAHGSIVDNITDKNGLGLTVNQKAGTKDVTGLVPIKSSWGKPHTKEYYRRVADDKYLDEEELKEFNERVNVKYKAWVEKVKIMQKDAKRYNKKLKKNKKIKNKVYKKVSVSTEFEKFVKDYNSGS